MSQEINTFCEKVGHICTFGYCDENGCQERKRRYTALGISHLEDDELLKHLSINLTDPEQCDLVMTELMTRLGNRSRPAPASVTSPVEPHELDGLPEGEYHLSDLENRLYKPFGETGLPLDDASLLDHVCQYARRLQRAAALTSSLGGAETPVWVSVEERLPEAFHMCLVARPGEQVSGMAYRCGDLWHAFPADEDSPALQAIEVTHWQPLPQVPTPV